LVVWVKFWYASQIFIESGKTMMRIKYLILCAILLPAVAGLLLTTTGCARYRDIPPGTVKEIRGPGFEGVGVTDLQQAKPGSGMGSKATGSAIPAGTAGRAGEAAAMGGQKTTDPAGSTTTRPTVESRSTIVKADTVTGRNPRSPILESETVTVQPLQSEPPPSPDYIVGPYDVLSVNVSGKPEFSSIALPVGATPTSTGSNLGVVTPATGCRVDGNGNIQLPFVGTVHVWGMTPLEIQNRLMDIYPKYFNNPWVIVDVKEYRSHPLYLLGQFRNSGTFYMDQPLNLLQGIALGNGYDATADLSASRLIREKRTMPVDIYDLLTNGDQQQNVWLKPGDTLYIPNNTNRQVFIFGAVKKPGPLPIPSGGLTLSQAIASADLRDTGYDMNYVRIIRSYSATRGELMVIDFEKMMRGDTLPLALRNGDIIYVPKSHLGTWNDAIAEILPTLQAFSALLQPFVNIKYLQQ
jgi:polysaccharide export outer membrane protein